MGNDWDFKFKDDDATNVVKSRKKGKQIASKRKTKEDDEILDFEKSVDIKLDFRSVRKRKPRGEYLGRETSKVQQVEEEEELASPDERLMAILLDYVVVGISYFFSNSIMATLLPNFNLSAEEVVFINDYGKYVIVIIFFLLINLIFPLLFKKTIGMLVFKHSVLDREYNQLGIFKMWMREIIYKPLGIISIIGLFLIFSKDNQSLWDRLVGSIVVSDRVKL